MRYYHVQTLHHNLVHLSGDVGAAAGKINIRDQQFSKNKKSSVFIRNSNPEVVLIPRANRPDKKFTYITKLGGVRLNHCLIHLFSLKVISNIFMVSLGL